MSAESYHSPETGEEYLREYIADQVRRSQDVVGIPPWGDIPETRPILEEYSYIGEAFQRARDVLQGITGNDYWQAEYGLFALADPVASGGRQEFVHTRSQRLLELVALSRAPIESVDAHWRLPDARGIRAVITEMREDLGISEVWETDPRGLEAPHFPGVSYDQVVAAIINGSLRIGNPRQPAVICYSPVPFLDTPVEKSGQVGRVAQQHSIGDQVTRAIGRVIESLRPNKGVK